MARKQSTSPHLKKLEQAMAARFGWQVGGHWREGLIAIVKKKAEKLSLDEATYCQMAITSSGELEGLANMVCNTETRFFRDPEQFQVLKEVVLPSLIKLRSRDRSVDLWSAACSTGEEAYSLTIMLCDILPATSAWKVSVLATDLRGQAIISATQGRYPLSAIGLLDAEVRNRYFVKAETEGQEPLFDVVPAVRRMIKFRRANLYDPQFWKNLDREFDLIVCNNLLLYFNPLAARQTVDRMVSVLRRGGMLVVMRNEMHYVDHPRLRIDSDLPGAFFKKL
jgi:chemotaxis methyl-accepting protein methylase